MKSRLSVAFLLMGWLGSLTVLAAAASIGLVIAQVLFWPVLALGAAAFALVAGVNREGAARWFVLAPGLVGPVLVLYGAVTGAQGPGGGLLPRHRRLARRACRSAHHEGRRRGLTALSPKSPCRKKVGRFWCACPETVLCR